jgi:hypothetical protein
MPRAGDGGSIALGKEFVEIAVKFLTHLAAHAAPDGLSQMG